MLSFFNPDDFPPPPEARAAEEELFRYIANCLHLFGLCRRTACYRKRKCHGDPRECVARFAPLVPDEARVFMRAMLDGCAEGRPFEELETEFPGEMAEFAYWRALIENTRTPGTVDMRDLLAK